MALHPIGFALRNTGSGFALIDDSAHLPVGVDRTPGAVTHTAGNAIKVLFDQAYQHVVSLVVGPDERMAAEGVVCGASVGLAFMVIYCYSSSGVLLSPSAMTWPSSNLWVSGTMSDT